MLLNSPVLTRVCCPGRWRLCARGLTLVATVVVSFPTLRPLSGVAAEEQKPQVLGSGHAYPTKARAAVGKGAEKPSVERWIVMPVTTELQRVSAGPNARAYVVVDGDWFRQSGNGVELDAQALNLNGLRRQLQAYADAEKGTVYFYIRGNRGVAHVVRDGRSLSIKQGPPGEPEQPDYVTDVLWCALQGLGQQAGFRDATVAPIYFRGQGASWESLVAELKKGLAEDAGRQETGIGSGKFKVYAVRTTLARFMYVNADCVLHVLVESGIGPNDLKAIEESVAKLNLKNKHWFHIIAPGTIGGVLGRPEFFKARLGFEHCTMQMGSVRRK